jgi:hypothetical protein
MSTKHTHKQGADDVVCSLRVYDKDVNGCIRHGSDVMISFGVFATPDKPFSMDVIFHDFFLTSSQAYRLMGQLEMILGKEEIRDQKINDLLT